MPEILTTELKSDLEYIYKVAGDLLNELDQRDWSKDSEDTRKMMEIVKFRLADIGGTLQKDIFNCDYLITKFRILKTGE